MSTDPIYLKSFGEKFQEKIIYLYEKFASKKKNLFENIEPFYKEVFEDQMDTFILRKRLVKNFRHRNKYINRVIFFLVFEVLFLN